MAEVGETWRPTRVGGMARIVLRLEPAGVVYREGWPSQIVEALDRWETWDAWVARTQAKQVPTE